MLLGMGISQDPTDHSIKLFQTAYVDSLPAPQETCS